MVVHNKLSELKLLKYYFEKCSELIFMSMIRNEKDGILHNLNYQPTSRKVHLPEKRKIYYFFCNDFF